jgi:t-SNARE complex subunit (syntaxin)
MMDTNTDMNSPAYQREKKQTFLICVVVIIVIILFLVFL